MGVCSGVAAISHHTCGAQHAGPKCLETSLGDAGFIIVESLSLLPPHNIPYFSFPGDFLAGFREHWPSFRDPYHQQYLWRGVCGTATGPGAAGSLHLTGKHQTTLLASFGFFWFEH